MHNTNYRIYIATLCNLFCHIYVLIFLRDNNLLILLKELGLLNEERMGLRIRD